MRVGQPFADLFGDGYKQDSGDSVRDAATMLDFSTDPLFKDAPSTHKVATTKLMHAKTNSTLNRPIPSTPFSRTLFRSSSRPDDRTARPSADPDMAMNTIDHWKE